MAEIPSIDISLILGPVVVSALVNALLAGICMVQYLEYYESRIKDGPTITGLVIWVAIVDTFSSCTSSSLLWHYTVDSFENKTGLLSTPWQYNTVPMSTTLISVPVQFFLAWRIRVFSESFVLFVVICTLSLAQGGLAFASSMGALLEPNVEANARRIPVADSWLAISVACDASITAALSYYLLKSSQCHSLIAQNQGVRLTQVTVDRHSEDKPALDIFIAHGPIVHVGLQSIAIMIISGDILFISNRNTLMTTLNTRSVLRRQMRPRTVPTLGHLFQSGQNNSSSHWQDERYPVQTVAPSNSTQVDVISSTMMDDLSVGGKKVKRLRSDITDSHGEQEPQWQNSKGDLETLILWVTIHLETERLNCVSLVSLDDV
ncbi:hypothetical protein D9758_011944 [Tetrapyrgos nigripes]|uniref:Uncharacterized protein n=1 Tax=Tetrapyrgos nigripes TaxID=182062 RepID=A0A8H5D2J5_9AGAR|nr:hypothetical protein D9758_011944 [Tetrapyrgos nigripes]